MADETNASMEAPATGLAPENGRRIDWFDPGRGMGIFQNSTLPE